jgi:hypothetical protein
MTEPTIGNDEIREDQQAFMAAYERARLELGEIPGVVGVGFGHKQVGGVFSDDVCVIVFVREKRAADDVPAAERIPKSYEGYRTDVRDPVAVVPGGCDNDTEYSTIQGGIQIQVDPTSIGTLGCIVRRRGDTGRENVYLLSNKHVLWSTTHREGSYAYHPYSPSGSRKSNSLGPVQREAKFDNVPSTVPDASGNPVQRTFFIDCATARIDIDSTCCGSTCTKDTTEYAESVIDLQVNGVNTITDIRSIASDVSIVIPSGPAGPAGPFVYKVGRTTGRTRGIVRSVNATLHTIGDPSVPGSPPMVGSNVVEIDFDPSSTPNHLNCHGNPFFGEHGDSGSLVVDDAGRAVGLLEGVPDPSIPGSSSTVACHILPVLDFLGVCLPTTTGTSHGSTKATDGSGLSLSAMGDFEPGDATIQFARATPAFADTGPTLMSVTDSERDHMLHLRERFRATSRVPELHEVFAQVRREVGYLVRNSRRVKVVWHRGEGPAFMAHTLNHLKGASPTIPTEVDGVTRQELLTRMGEALSVHGSIPLREAVERYGDILLPILSTAGTLDEAIERLATLDAIAVPASAVTGGDMPEETP